jgi:hypothetical protein
MKSNGQFFIKSRKGQVTVFIIIAILIFAGIIAYFTLRSSLTTIDIPANIEPAYTTFLNCLEDDTSTGIRTIESQGGYIFLPEFEPGSQYMPFSSQLNFLGNPIPYWYYVSGNNIQKEQVPTKNEMEDQLGEFIETRISDCNLRTYYAQGFEISLGEPEASSTITDNEVEVDLDMNLNLAKGNESVTVRNHKVVVKSKLGSLYDSAKEVYDKEQESLFLEEYAVDILRLYAPVDGVELTCSPLVWNANKVFDELQEAIEANTMAIDTGIDEYFDVDLPVDEEVRFLNSRNWPNGFEVTPSEEILLIANPVGNQPGLGVIGFCYVPYHFVYDVKYPVLVQVYSGDEIFQYPMAVVLLSNNPREPLNATAIENVVPELCLYKNTEVSVIAKDTQGRSVDADISYECFGNKCNIGQASSGVLKADFPQCVNGYVLAKADGYKDSRYLFSTVAGGSVSIFMEKLYTKNVDLKLDGKNYNGNAIITFISGDSSKTIAYPEQKTVELGEGQYETNVYVYKNSSINIGATTTEQCIDVPRSGVLGIFGLTKERCFEIEIPEQIISNALAGGGKQNHYILESELVRSNTLEINAESLDLPETIEELQINYLLFEGNGLEIEFR